MASLACPWYHSMNRNSRARVISRVAVLSMMIASRGQVAYLWCMSSYDYCRIWMDVRITAMCLCWQHCDWLQWQSNPSPRSSRKQRSLAAPRPVPRISAFSRLVIRRTRMVLLMHVIPAAARAIASAVAVVVVAGCNIVLRTADHYHSPWMIYERLLSRSCLTR